jgi:hypothetical protein
MGDCYGSDLGHTLVVLAKCSGILGKEGDDETSGTLVRVFDQRGNSFGIERFG